MKAILIDPAEKAIIEVVFTGDFRNIYEHIDAHAFTTVMINNMQDVIYLDDMGLYREPQDFFLLEGYPNPLAGKGLVLGTDMEGESTEPMVATTEWLENSITFISGQEAYEIAKANDAEYMAKMTEKENAGFAVFFQPSAPMLERYAKDGTV